MDEPRTETAQVRGRRRRRWRFPLLVVLIATVVIGVLHALPEGTLDRGGSNIYSVIAAAIAAVLSFGWFLFSGGFSTTTRLVGVALVAVVITIPVFAVRRVEFTGDMHPILEFRWQEQRDELLEAHRGRQADAAGALRQTDLSTVRDTDMAEYRGRRRDGIVESVPLVRDWDKAAPQSLWRQPVGGGYAAFSVVGDVAVTIEQRRGREAIVCYDAKTGGEIWVYDYPARFSETLGGVGPRASTTIARGNVYALGATGELVCLEGSTGKPRWRANILELAGAKNLDWGMSGSPLVVGDVVVVNPGGQGAAGGERAVLALDADTGELRWASGNAQAGYASPQLSTLAGAEWILIFDAAGLAGLDPATGTEQWRFPWKSDFDINAAQPLVLGEDRVLISSNAGAALLELRREDGEWTAAPVWKNRNLKCAYANPIALDGCVYGLDEGILVCLDAETGQRHWKRGRHGHGQMLFADGALVILSEEGKVVLVEPTHEEYREIASFAAIEGRTWNNPALVDGKLYVRNHLEMACYDLAAEASEKGS